jgi:hypothetical protein
MFPLTLSDPESELANKLRVCTEAIRMIPDLSMASRDAQARVVAALIHASAMADLAQAIRNGGTSIESGLDVLAGQIEYLPR